MDFEGFLGNEAVKERLSGALSQGKITHCYLLSGPEGSGKHTLAQILCAAFECTGDAPPCRRCPQCRKVLTGNHPDVIFVDDETKKTIPVEQVRGVCADVFIRPNEGARKIYVFPHAEKLSPAGQNTLLKVLEEPPAYAVFLLLTPHPGQLLPTVRSRCAALHLAPLPEATLLSELRRRAPSRPEEAYREAAAETGYLGQALRRLEAPLQSPQTAAFVEAYAKKDALLLLELLTPMEKWKRDQILPVLQEWEALLTAALAIRLGLPGSSEALRRLRAGRTGRELLRGIEALRRAEEFCNANVGTGAVCGALAVQLL